MQWCCPLDKKQDDPFRCAKGTHSFFSLKKMKCDDPLSSAIPMVKYQTLPKASLINSGPQSYLLFEVLEPFSLSYLSLSNNTCPFASCVLLCPSTVPTQHQHSLNWLKCSHTIILEQACRQETVFQRYDIWIYWAHSLSALNGARVEVRVREPEKPAFEPWLYHPCLMRGDVVLSRCQFLHL